MQGDLSTQQFQKVLQLCSMLGLEDFVVAAEILKENQWNLQKAIGLDVPPQPQYIVEPSPQIIHEDIQQDIPLDYQMDDQQVQGEGQYEYYQKQCTKQQKLQQNKNLFNQGFISIPLLKSKSQYKNDNIQTRLSLSKATQDMGDYQTDLTKNSDILCSRIFSQRDKQLQRHRISLKNQDNNRKFITHLHTHYHSSINFAFGSFYLQLARAHLANKPLLVYIHSQQHQDNKSVHLILKEKSIAKYVNKNCVCFGMFDSADDYQILQKYVQIKNLPAFALFRLDRKELRENLTGFYPILTKQKNFENWLEEMTGINFKKAINNNINIVQPVEKSMLMAQKMVQKNQLSEIIYEQNFQYEEMAKLHELRRNKSKIRQKQSETFESQIQEDRKAFANEPELITGSTIQIRFRLPVTGTSFMRLFELGDKVQKMFNYIHCFGRDQFEDKMADFDLTQTFPRLSLQARKGALIGQVFDEGAERQNLIVKEL